jgi:hypothetical protein
MLVFWLWNGMLSAYLMDAMGVELSLLAGHQCHTGVACCVVIHAALYAALVVSVMTQSLIMCCTRMTLSTNCRLLQHVLITQLLAPDTAALHRDFKATLDYVLYTRDSLAPAGLLELPAEAEVVAKPGDSLPNANWSSDHVCLMAEFQILQHKG